MQYILTGFSQDMGFRVFTFERIGDDRLRTKFTVKADLSLIRRYGIRLQELPLMCRGLLDRRDEGGEEGRDVSKDLRSLIFTEDDMGVYAKNCTAVKEAAAQKRKPPRRPPSENIGAAWRAPQP
jgi:hypothetical protein